MITRASRNQASIKMLAKTMAMVSKSWLNGKISKFFSRKRHCMTY